MTETAAHEAARPNGERHPHRKLGFAGRVAWAFVESPLTPLLLMAFFLIGLLGMAITPREEDPQISVPMVDIFVAYPGAAASEVANLVSEPLERLMSELPGVKHVYSMSRDGLSMVTVRFEVGERMEPSLVKLYNKLYSNMDLIPKGVMQPLVKPKSIDDVPVVTVTLSSSKLDLVQLRKLGLDALQRFKALPNTGQSFVTGGSREQVRIDVDMPRMSSHKVTLSQIAQAVGAANQRNPGGYVVDGGKWFNIYTGDFLATVADVENLVIAVDDSRPVFLRDVAKVTHGESETKSVVDNNVRDAEGGFVAMPAVTVAVAKKYGSNGIVVATELTRELDAMKGRLIPDSVTVTVTRDYGETAQDKVTHLIMKLFIVSGLVTILALLTMGTRPAMIVMITIPATLLMSISVAYVLGFTINRVSMFALVFAIGILVDDAIVVVENIYRRWLESGRTSDRITVEAVDEVGNPTILATFTVVAALLPMGFVSDMMGPYMLPIPVLSSAAMIFSLFAAFVFVPWLAARVKPSMSALKSAAEREHRQSEAIGRWYGSVITPIMDNPVVGYATLFMIFAAMLGAVSMFMFKSVAFKMLPYDNKSEMQVVIDMPEGTDLFVTANLAQQLGAELRKIPEVTAFQTYVGTSSPFNFNGLVRHYFLRGEPWQGDIAVQLLDKEKRSRSSHDIALYVRRILTPIAAASSARLTVAEAPPGPPVLAPMVIELYGPTPEVRRQVARDLIGILRKTPHLADIGTFMEAPHDNIEFDVDRLRAAMFGVSVEDINREVIMATGGFEAGPFQRIRNLEQATIVLQTPMATRGNIGNLMAMPVRSHAGAMVPLGELGRFVKRPVDPVIYHKDLRAVEYVTADVIGKLGAPLYGMLDFESALKKYVTPDGVHLSGNFFSRPETVNRSGFKWDGEWQVTYVTFRDMGLAFGAALVLIYMLVVAEFRSFMLPAVVMTPIPLTMIGIVPGHWLLGADFTATSMIGFIALAGIIVRNSILLVEFAREKVHEGWDVREAVITAGRVRLRPIMITALALVIGSMVLLSDPIFQGMAVSLLFGSLVATFLTLIVIPLGCISARKYFKTSKIDDDDDDGAPPNGHGPGPGPGHGPGHGPGPAPAPAAPAPAPGRPARLARQGEAAAAPPAPPAPAPETSGRPARLVRKADEPLAAPSPGASGRPARLVRKADEPPVAQEPEPAPEPQPLPAAPSPGASGRPPRLVRKAEEPPVVAAPEPEPEPPAPEPEPEPQAAPEPQAQLEPAPEPEPEPEPVEPPQAAPAPAPEPDQEKSQRQPSSKRERSLRGIRLKDISYDPGDQG